ncbi:MAG: hypothetical protein U9N46_04605 [Euryarchaeota archaeon]|nr:hypothetical protein [Euryarchaeota archaeon]
MIRKDMPDIVHGHEIWLEQDIRHAHVGETVECKLLLGHNMAVDGMADLKNVKAALYDPANEKHDLVVDTGDDCLILRFDPVIDGYHTDPGKGALGPYDEKVMTAVRSVMGVY